MKDAHQGMDFEVHTENTEFKPKRRRSMPSHVDIINDLILKRDSNPEEYNKVRTVINKLYRCEEVKNIEYLEINFGIRLPIETVLKSIEWLFIEQDVTYWNFSGRNMLYSALVTRRLC